MKPTIQCTKCQAVAVVVKHSWPRPDGRVQLLICKSCGHESNRLVEKLPPKKGATVRRDLLPDDFVAPNNGRKCWHCIEWRGLDDEIHPCTIGMPDVMTEGESFAADCEFYVRKGS